MGAVSLGQYLDLKHGPTFCMGLNIGLVSLDQPTSTSNIAPRLFPSKYDVANSEFEIILVPAPIGSKHVSNRE